MKGLEEENNKRDSEYQIYVPKKAKTSYFFERGFDQYKMLE